MSNVEVATLWFIKYVLDTVLSSEFDGFKHRLYSIAEIPDVRLRSRLNDELEGADSANDADQDVYELEGVSNPEMQFSVPPQ